MNKRSTKEKIMKQAMMLYFLNFREKGAMAKAVRYYFQKLKEGGFK